MTKTRLKTISRRSISMLLAVLMLCSVIGAGTVITVNAASSTYTVYFRNNGNWSNVYVLTGSNLNMGGSSGAYDNLYGPNINTFTAMELVPGETNVYKKSVTVYDNKIAFASANSTQYGYYASSGQICCVGNMASGKVVNMWTDNWKDQNGAAYKKYNLEDYTPPVPYITGINSDWSNGDAMTYDSGNNYYYAFTGDGYDKYFRFKTGSTYYEAYSGNFNLETDGDYKPYDGSTDNKKYGTRSGNSNAFKLSANAGYNYRIYFDASTNKCWFTKTARTFTATLNKNATDATAGTASVTATYNAAMPTSSVTMPTRTGYDFAGYYDTDAATGGTQYYTAAGASARTWNKASDTTLYARWTLKTYTITYKSGDNATGSDYTATKTHGSDLTLRDSTYSRTGYNQTGWSVNSDGSTKDYNLNGSYTANAAATLYPYWELKSYSVTLSETNASGGTLKVDGSVASTATHGSHTFRVDAPAGYEISSISGIGTWTKSADETYATLGSTSITENKTISVTYKVSTTPALRVNYTGSSGAATASTGSVTTSTRHNVTVTFTNQSAMTNGSNYSVTYTKDGGSATTLISGTTSTSGGELTAKAAGTLTAGTYVYTVTVGTKTSSVTVVVNQSRTLTVNTAANVASVSGSYTNEFGQTSQTISSSGTYYFKSGTAVSVTYTAADYYQISSGNYSGSPTSNTICTPTVSEKTHTLTVNNTVCTTDVYPTSVGEVTAATVTATTEKTVGSQKYIFSGWTISGTYQVTSGSTSSNSISITATTNVTMTANYNEYRATSAAIASGSNAMISSFRITYTNTSGSSATLTNTTDTVWAKVGTVSLRVTPNSGYKIKPSVTTTDNVTKTASSFSTSYQDITGINLAGSSSATDIFTISATEDTSQTKWYVVGEDIFGGWDSGSGRVMSYPSGGSGGNLVVYTFAVTSDKINSEYQFKIFDSTASGASRYYTSNPAGATITEDVTDLAFDNQTDGSANAKFTPNVVGTYKFTFNSNTKKLTVEYPGLEITYKENGSAYSGTTVTLSGNPTDAKAGNTVSFTATPANGRIITGVTYTTNAAGTTTSNATFVDEGGTVSFTMPSFDTTVNITTATAYTVTFANATNIALTAKVGSTSINTGKKVATGTTVTFTATFDEGYELDTSNLGTATSTTLNSSNKKVYTFDVSVTSDFTASISAKLIKYSLNTSSNTSSGGTVQFKRNSSSTTQNTSSVMVINDEFTPVVTPNAGYRDSSIVLRKENTTTTISGYSDLSSGTKYNMPAYNSTIYVTWAAVTPLWSTNNPIASSAGSVSDYTVTGVYAGQSITITPSLSTQGNISYTIAGTNSSCVTDNGNGTFTFATPQNIGNTANSTSTYSFTLKPKNSPTGVSAVDGEAKTITIQNVSYSDTQKAYMNLKTKYDEYAGYGITSDDLESGWSDFNSAMTTANNALGTFPNSLPEWNASDTYTAKKTALENAYGALVFKENTIYVLSKYEHSNSSYVNIYLFNNSTATHDPSPIFYTDTSLTTINNTARNYHMTYEGETNDHKHLYSFTYRGHQEFIIYRRSSETNTLTDGAKLTGDVDLRNTTNYPYGEYYIDVKNTDVTSSPSVTSAGEFTDFSISATGADSDLMVGQCKEGATGYTVSQIKDWLGITFNGSLASTSSQTVAQTYTITGPVGRGVSTTATVDSDNNWVPLKPGRYTVSLDASLGTDGRASAGATFTGAKSTVDNSQTVLDLFVAFDDIEIYADMNGNVGTPTIHFTYIDHENNDEETDLPYEFDMVTGSESVYSYTVSVSTLNDVYGLDLLNGTVTVDGTTYRGIKVDSISIDGVTIENSSFVFERAAARTGTLWLKADSSNMKTFNKIAYGSSTRTFKAVLRNGNTDTDFNNTFAEVNGTGIITDELVGDSYQYTSFYAAYDTTANYRFSYTLRVKAETDITHKDGNTTNYYYFDHWEAVNGTTTNTNPTEASGTDVNILKAPNYATDADVTYVAVYKLTSTQKRVEITYKFKDYDTDDENYVYDPDKPLKDATYTKTVNWNGTTALSTVAQNSCPIIKSNYFDYTFDASTANVTTTQLEDSNTRKTCITAELKQTPHKYKIILGSTTYKSYYQQSVALTAAGSNYKWYVKDANNNKIVIGNGQTYNARFGIYQDASSDTESGVSYQYDICTIYNESGTAAINSSIVPAHQEVYYDNDTPKVRHNFFIIDAYDNSGEFVGAGVLYATTDSSGNYRQTNAQNVLGSTNSVNTNGISNFIKDVLNPNDNINTAKYNTEFKAQTINNIGFRYLPYSGNESILRYSNELKAYMYTFAGENTNSASMQGQKLRVFSFFVYKSGNTYTNVVSSMYAEVERYIPQS